MRKHILIITCLLAVGIDASAQEFTGSIYGRIVDPTNALMPGVSITVEGDAIQGQRTVDSEANGSYRFLYLPPGEYRVTFQKPGFKKIVYDGAKVEVDKTLTRNVTMQIAAIDETVAVTGNSPTVDVRNATVGTNWGETFLRDIPNQRDLFALLAMTPGITMPRPDVGGNRAGEQTGYRAYGVSGESITTVDGVNITTSGGIAYTDYGAMAEAKVSAAGNTAEVPGAGAAVTTVIRSGSNTQHGEFFADYKPGGDTRGEFFADRKLGREDKIFTETYRQYRDINGQFGGPFIKDKLWYFTSVRDQKTVFRTAMYDSPPEQRGTHGQRFTTETSNVTIKLNYQLSRQGTLTFMTQWGRKYQPYRFGAGAAAHNYAVESTALQDSRTQIGKVNYLRVINNRATLDVSVNLYGNQFPLGAHTDKTPIIDDFTNNRIGAYTRPNFREDRRWHSNATLNLYAGKHDMKIGYMYQSDAPRNTAYGAPGPAWTAGHFYILTTRGVPTAFLTDNGPVSSVNVLKNHALFFQDKFQVMSKLTLNYGIRFDRYDSSYPEQGFGLNGDRPCVDGNNCDVGPFAVELVTPARDVVTLNNVVPRVAVIYDLFGNSKTALKASWGRYATNPAEYMSALVNPIDLITKRYTWDTTYLTADPGVAATRITPEYIATRRTISADGQLTPTAVDPNLTNSYTDEYTFGVDQEIAGDLRGYVTVVGKREKNRFGRYDRLRMTSHYNPVQAVDPGPDGADRTADDRTVTVWEIIEPSETTDYYLTNKPIGDTHTTFELGVTKRLRNHWQLISGVDWSKRTVSSPFSEDPNTVVWGSSNTQTAGWTFKASGSYVFNHGVMVALFYNAMKGQPYGRDFLVARQYLALADPNRTTALAQGNITILAEKAGAYYLPTINVINIRVQKEFVIKNTQRLHLMMNVFNLSGAKTVNGVEQSTGPYFNWPTATIGERVVRFSMRYAF